MKCAFLLALAAGSLLLAAGCASDPASPKSDRLSGSAGVTVSSQDMSRIAPTRPVP